MIVKLFYDHNPVMTFLSRESAEEYKARHSTAMQARMEIKPMAEKNGVKV